MGALICKFVTHSLRRRQTFIWSGAKSRQPIARYQERMSYNLRQSLLRRITKKPIFCTRPDKNAYRRKLKDRFPIRSACQIWREI